MSTAAPLQTHAAKPRPPSSSTHAGLLLQRKCACGSPTSSLTGECAECNSGKRLQTKLTIGASNDPLEQEADRVADKVLAAPANPAVSGAPPHIQRLTGQATGQTDTAPASVDRVLARPSRPLDPAPVQDMGQRFGHDFSRVRVHFRGAALTGEPASDTSDTPAEIPSANDAAIPASHNLPGLPGACVANPGMTLKRSGINRTSTGSVTEDFEVHVEWRDSKQQRKETSYCASECGEYHQFVKGYLKSSSNMDGSDLKDVSGNVFGGTPLDQNSFNEDGIDGNPKARYGHRKEKQTMNESYLPDRATGTQYVGKDSPAN